MLYCLRMKKLQTKPFFHPLSYSSCFGRQDMSQLQECLAAEVLDGGPLRNRRQSQQTKQKGWKE